MTCDEEDAMGNGVRIGMRDARGLGPRGIGIGF